jgi:hypothetical protein
MEMAVLLSPIEKKRPLGQTSSCLQILLNTTAFESLYVAVCENSSGESAVVKWFLAICGFIPSFGQLKGENRFFSYNLLREVYNLHPGAVIELLTTCSLFCVSCM